MGNGSVFKNKQGTQLQPKTSTSLVYDANGKNVDEIIGSLGSLSTTNKSNLVAAINEVKSQTNKPSGGWAKTDLAAAVQTSLGKADTAVQPQSGKGLSTNDYTTADKTKLANLDAIINGESGGESDSGSGGTDSGGSSSSTTTYIADVDLTLGTGANYNKDIYNDSSNPIPSGTYILKFTPKTAVVTDVNWGLTCKDADGSNVVSTTGMPITSTYEVTFSRAVVSVTMWHSGAGNAAVTTAGTLNVKLYEKGNEDSGTDSGGTDSGSSTPSTNNTGLVGAVSTLQTDVQQIKTQLSNNPSTYSSGIKLYALGDSTNTDDKTRQNGTTSNLHFSFSKVIAYKLKADVYKNFSTPGVGLDHSYTCSKDTSKIPNDANLIIILCGINNLYNHSPEVGNIDEILAISNVDDIPETTMLGIYTKMVKKLRARLTDKKAQIVCVTPIRFAEDTESDFINFKNGVRKLCWSVGSSKGMRFVDGTEIGTQLDKVLVARDGTHPMIEGATIIANKVMEHITPYELADEQYDILENNGGMQVRNPYQ